MPLFTCGVATKFKSNFGFGGPAAESDPLLTDAYFDNGDFSAINDPKDHHRFIIGRTGSGKSAAFRHLHELHPNQVVRLTPDSVSLPFITNLNIVRRLSDLNVHLEPFFNALWKHVILVEVLKHRYAITSPEAKKTIFYQLLETFQRDDAKRMAIEYMNEFGESFWCEAHERVREIIDKFEKRLGATGQLRLDVGPIGGSADISSDTVASQEVRQELAERYQRIVNETQLPRLNLMLTILGEEILRGHWTYLVIDDLDRDWVDDTIANLLIRCLFTAVLDMQTIGNLKVLVALRTNIFQQLQYGEKLRGGQEEKFRGLALEIRWTKNDLLALMDERALAACRHYKVSPPRTLKEMLPRGPRHRDAPVDYILSNTLMRPRDAIVYVNECVRLAAGTDHISWNNIRDARRGYSENRLLALRDEWKEPYFGIDRALDKFRSASLDIGRTELTTVLDDVALLREDPTFPGVGWITEMCAGIWSGMREWPDMYGPICKWLFSIGFLGAIVNRRELYFWDDPFALDSPVRLSEQAQFCVHPAFRPALAISDEARQVTHD
jgi:hypothetical protein